MSKISKESYYSKLALLKFELIVNDNNKVDVDLENLYTNLCAESNFDVDYAIVLIEYNINKKNYSLALRIVDEYEKKTDAHFDILIKKVEIYIRLNKYNEALEELSILIKLNKSAIVLEKISYIFYKLNLQNKAITYIDMAIEINKYQLSSWELKLKIFKSIKNKDMIKECEQFIDYLNTKPLNS